MTAIQKNALNIISSLSDKKLKDAYDFLTYLSDKEEWEATQELYDQAILSEIREGVKQMQKGQFVYLKDIRRNV